MLPRLKAQHENPRKIWGNSSRSVRSRCVVLLHSFVVLSPVLSLATTRKFPSKAWKTLTMRRRVLGGSGIAALFFCLGFSKSLQHVGLSVARRHEGTLLSTAKLVQTERAVWSAFVSRRDLPKIGDCPMCQAAHNTFIHSPACTLME